MIRERTRARLLALFLASGLCVESVALVWSVRRCRALCARATSECAEVRAATSDAVAACLSALDDVRAVLAAVPPPEQRVCADAALPAPSTRVVGVGTNGKYQYIDLSTDRHDGEPPEVRRIYRRIPPEQRAERFRPAG